MVAGSLFAASTAIATVAAGSLSAATSGATSMVAVSVGDPDPTAAVVATEPMVAGTSATGIVVAGVRHSATTAGAAVAAVAMAVSFIGAAPMAAGAMFASTVGATAVGAGPMSARTTGAAIVAARTMAGTTTDFVSIDSRGTSPCTSVVISAVLEGNMVLRFFASVIDSAAGSATARFGCIAIRNAITVAGHMRRSTGACHVDAPGVKRRTTSTTATAQSGDLWPGSTILIIAMCSEVQPTLRFVVFITGYGVVSGSVEISWIQIGNVARVAARDALTVSNVRIAFGHAPVAGGWFRENFGMNISN